MPSSLNQLFIRLRIQVNAILELKLIILDFDFKAFALLPRLFIILKRSNFVDVFFRANHSAHLFPFDDIQKPVLFQLGINNFLCAFDQMPDN